MLVAVLVRMMRRGGLMCLVGFRTWDGWAPASRAYCLLSGSSSSRAWYASVFSYSSSAVASCPVVWWVRRIGGRFWSMEVIHCPLRGVGVGGPCCGGALKLGCSVRQCAFRGWYRTPLPCRLPRMRSGGAGLLSSCDHGSWGFMPCGSWSRVACFSSVGT